MNIETKEKSCQTDEELIYNYAWSKYHQHFINFYKSTENNTIKEIDKSETELSDKLDAESIKKIAENAMENKGFLYDPKSGLYFDTQNGLYYDQNKQLYFDIQNGIAYHYITNTQNYTYYLRFHSKIPKIELSHLRKIIGLSLEKSSDTEKSSDSENEMKLTSKYPPCIRAIMIEYNSPINTDQDSKLLYELGSLFLIPYTGGLIGSCSTNSKNKYVLNFPDIYDINEVHASIRYDKKKKVYLIKDEKSVSGTFVNDKKLDLNEEIELSHGDTLKIGDAIKLLIHIHEGSCTCINCEPGEVMHKLKQEKLKMMKNIQMNEKTKEDLRRENVKLIKSKYGLKRGDEERILLESDYVDRAKERRNELGVDYSHIENVNEKKIETSNIGLKLMSKMGWKEGKGLGKEETGIVEPITTKLKLDKSGIGAEDKNETSLNIDEKQKRKILNWKKTKERYESVKNIQNNSKLASVFNAEDDESD
ncbi:unnamed protein product [Brachionus calyciflorus]|uniref:Angiogenic factor with G patch and FHA domains 1 n=1 Tax=Brachionus calyciflorus TaxID=104777 RepID=A0A814CEW3_9BILA|nr:unnamed protein product [Brachionus calyciflorus]